MNIEKSPTTLLLIGAGSLGRAILLDLCRAELPLRIVATSLHPHVLEPFLSLLRVSSAARGFEARLEGIELDLRAADRATQKIASIQPDIVLMTATRQTWWLLQLFPERIRLALQEAGYGPWLPVHFDLTHRLMKILQGLGMQSRAITASYPDVINSVLGCLGMAPRTGFGNVDEIVAQVRVRVAEHFRIPLATVSVLLVAHHALQAALSGRSSNALPPYALRIEAEEEGRLDSALARRLLLRPHPLPPGPAIHTLTAACATRLIRSLLFPAGEILHVPGPGGLPGGYPVRLQGRRLEVERFDGMSLEQMIEINQRSLPFDGLEAIRNDGTVVLTPSSAEIMKKKLGYDGLEFKPDEAGERADELIERFRRLAQEYQVDLNRIHSPQEF